VSIGYIVEKKREGSFFKMIREIYGKKIGMTQVFSEEGDLIATTLVEVETACMLEKVDSPGGPKVRIGCFEILENKIKKIKKPAKGYFDKLGVSPYKLIREVEAEPGADFSFEQTDSSRVPSSEQIGSEESSSAGEAGSVESSGNAAAESSQEQESAAGEVKTSSSDIDSKEQDSSGVDSNVEVSAGEDTLQESKQEKRNPREIGIEIFKEGDLVDVRARTKGKGFAGGMKRHGWHGQPKSHGSTSHRRIGSAGASAYPSKIIKGLGMPGHMGNRFRTARNLKISKIDSDKNILFIKGNIPGARGAVVKLRKAGPHT